MAKILFARTHLIYIFVLLLALSFVPEARAQGGSLLDLGEHFDGLVLEDIGRTDAGMINLIGNQEVDGENIARLFTISQDRQSFTYDRLFGLGTGTRVLGISSDGSRAAGFSSSPDSVDTEGLSWDLGNSSFSAEGIGFMPGYTNNSFAAGAWSGGVVGDHDGFGDAVSYTSSNGLSILQDSGGLSSGRDVSIDGNIVVGLSSDFGATSGAVFWDATGIHQLYDPYGSQSIANAVSSNALHIGGEIDFFDPDTFESGTLAAEWSRDTLEDDFELNILQMLNSDTGELDRFFGRIQDISDDGWMVGSYMNDLGEEAGLIDHYSFNGIDSEYLGAQSFDLWFENESGLLLPTNSRSIDGISVDPFTGEMNFAINGSSAYFGSVLAVPEPNSTVIAFLAISSIIMRRRRGICDTQSH